MKQKKQCDIYTVKSLFREEIKLTFETSQFEMSSDHNLALYKCLYWNSAMSLMNWFDLL